MCIRDRFNGREMRTCDREMSCLTLFNGREMRTCDREMSCLILFSGREMRTCDREMSCLTLFNGREMRTCAIPIDEMDDELCETVHYDRDIKVCDTVR